MVSYSYHAVHWTPELIHLITGSVYLLTTFTHSAYSLPLANHQSALYFCEFAFLDFIC